MLKTVTKQIPITISILFVLSLILGCGNGVSGRVSGTVSLDGKPLADAAVTFYPEVSGAMSVGMTDTNGNYELAVSHTVKGIVPGRYKVTISTAREERAGNAPGAASIPAVPELVPPKFTDHNSTDLIREVKAGSQKMDFALTSDSDNKTSTETKTETDEK
jgi:hypothetical protein